jgi:hypothetical protein
MGFNLTEDEHAYLKNITDSFGECDSNCESCKAYEKMNQTDCTFCDLLLTYRIDINRKLNQFIDTL